MNKIKVRLKLLFIATNAKWICRSNHVLSCCHGNGHSSYYVDDLRPLFEEIKILKGRKSVFSENRVQDVKLGLFSLEKDVHLLVMVEGLEGGWLSLNHDFDLKPHYWGERRLGESEYPISHEVLACLSRIPLTVQMHCILRIPPSADDVISCNTFQPWLLLVCRVSGMTQLFSIVCLSSRI